MSRKGQDVGFCWSTERVSVVAPAGGASVLIGGGSYSCPAEGVDVEPYWVAPNRDRLATRPACPQFFGAAPAWTDNPANWVVDISSADCGVREPGPLGPGPDHAFSRTASVSTWAFPLLDRIEAALLIFGTLDQRRRCTVFFFPPA